MKKTAIGAAIAAAVVGAGATAYAVTATAPGTSPAATASPTAGAPTAPAAAASVDPSTGALTADAPGLVNEVDARFLANVRDRAAEAGIGSNIPALSDRELLAAAAEACAQLPVVAGDFEGVRLFEGETTDPGGYFWDSMTVAARAGIYYCPEWAPDIVVNP